MFQKLLYVCMCLGHVYVRTCVCVCVEQTSFDAINLSFHMQEESRLNKNRGIPHAHTYLYLCRQHDDF